LLAHELAHVVQQSSPGSRNNGLVQRACLPASECPAAAAQGPVTGSAATVDATMAAQEAAIHAARPPQTPSGRRAPEVEKLFKARLPNRSPLVYGIFVDDELPPTAGAGHGDCGGLAARAVPADQTALQGAAGRGCIRVHGDLEKNAGIYNNKND